MKGNGFISEWPTAVDSNDDRKVKLFCPMFDFIRREMNEAYEWMSGCH